MRTLVHTLVHTMAIALYLPLCSVEHPAMAQDAPPGNGPLLSTGAATDPAAPASPAPGGIGSGVASTPQPQDQQLAVHGQGTFTLQATPGFAAPYAGANSLAPHQAKETFDATLFLGVRPWQGAEIWINPEIDQGFGLSDTLGIAGFSSGEAYKVGRADPYFKLQRIFLRQTINLGGAISAIDPAANQLAGHQRADRLVITLGKFSTVDVFDTNSYAHDPRGDFLNWSVIDAGSFDYAANAWGYTYGAAVEWYQGAWALRTGIFDLSVVPNDEALDNNASQYQLVEEVEHRHTIAGHPGALRGGFYLSHGRFASLADAIALYKQTGSIPADLAPLRHYRDKWGIYLNAEQEVSAAVGLFLRAGYGDGKSEADEFSDIDRTLSLGSQIKGNLWHRSDDRLGFAAAVNGISKEHQEFFNDGGLGILVGDGRLPHPGDEWIAESWYTWAVIHHVRLTADYQFVKNPGYNQDRGPISIFTLRLHIGDD